MNRKITDFRQTIQAFSFAIVGIACAGTIERLGYASWSTGLFFGLIIGFGLTGAMFFAFLEREQIDS